MGKQWREAKPSEMDEQRKLLDELMGQERNLNEDEKLHRQKHFSDPDVCKYYICGLSPYNLFKNTKSDLGPYDKVFDDDCKRQWEELSQNEKDKYGYEYELMLFLEKLVGQCDSKVKRHSERVNQEHSDELARVETALVDRELQRIGEIELDMPRLEAEVVQLGEAGRLGEALAALQRAEMLRSEMNQLETKAIQAARDSTGRRHMIVCEVSGNFMNSSDNGDRLRCHFEGKQYQGWRKIRDKLAVLKAQDPPPPGGSDRRRDDRRDRRDRDWDRDRDYRGGDRDRGYRGDRDRRDRDRDWRDNRDRDRSRDYRGSRRRSRSRSRSRERDRRRR